MTRLLYLSFLLALAPAVLAQDVTDLRVGRAVTDALVQGETDAFAIWLDADQFVAGRADQISVDVVIVISGPQGEHIDRIDVSGRGAEPFQFESGGAGLYRIEITPFEEEEGDYSLIVERVEPIATDPEGVVDQIMATLDHEDSPGVVVGVVRDRELSFSAAYGMANLTYGIPFAVDTPTNIGSTSKQFTAFAIALLAERGQLGLDDDVRDYIPELPDLGETVTIRHLLTHTSGFREFLNALAIGGRRLDLGDGIERGELIELIQRQTELQNAPGSEWNYNNTAFGLLAEVVARVSGESFPEWMATNVFEPLGMTSTTVRASNSQIIPGASQGYVADDEGGWQSASDLGGAMGAGGIYTTMGDLAKWMQNYWAPTVGSTGLIEQMTTPYILASGDTTGYGFGLFVDEFRGQRRFQHGGADTAHRSEFGLLPDLRIGLIILANSPAVAPDAGERIAEAFFGDLLDPAVEEEAASIGTSTTDDDDSFDPADFDDFAGRYAMEEVPGFILTFRRDGDRYYTQATGQPEFELFHTSGTSFELRVVEAAMTFNRDAEGNVRTITLHQNGDHVANRMEETGPTLDLAEYVGRYFSDELEAFYTVASLDGALVLEHRRWDDISLSHVTGEKFSGGFPIADVEFERDEQGAVSGFRAGSGRTRDVWFERVN